MCAVAVLTALVVYIAHWVGLPYYWQKSPTLTILLVIFGYWLLMNVSFHYYMAVTTHPGVPPEVINLNRFSIIFIKQKYDSNEKLENTVV